ncbi:hypothetical protein E2562_024105 [Oryza meyeriana var. granulata]|uniref:Uncharacterized protein n=1 Tax=Oryza meyeriana var. granulata TaxID=110450 RepID=A0A6G1CH19_9ORYZ|nr:hypothetical protein E2562_024105 [Oryza meyeriana var. granulata]
MDGTSRSMRVVSCNASLRGLVHTEESYSYRSQTSFFRQETIIRFVAMAARWVTCMVELHCGMERLLQNMPKGRIRNRLRHERAERRTEKVG